MCGPVEARGRRGHPVSDADHHTTDPLSLPVCLPVRAVLNLFLALAVFGGKCWDRDWLMYPNYNFLSWSYYMAVFSCGFHTIAALLYGMVSHAAGAQRVWTAVFWSGRGSVEAFLFCVFVCVGYLFCFV